MTPSIKGMARACVLALATAFSGAAAMAESGYGCSGLVRSSLLPSLEGDGGHFFRIYPDLHMDLRLEPGATAQVAALARALETRGTTLIYVPVPTKALAMPDMLPPEARDLGYEVDLAATIYQLALRDLRAAGVHVVDARHALRKTRGGAKPVFQADPRLTAAGAEALATATASVIAEVPGYARVTKGLFKTRTAGSELLSSHMRMILQEHCSSPLPQVNAQRNVTEGVTGLSMVAATGTIAPATQSATVVVVGTEIAGQAAGNFAGFLAGYSKLQTAPVTVAGGGAFAAISSYLTSASFQQSPPAYLVWTHPVWHGLADYGDQPMAELIAAAGATCDRALPLTLDRAGVAHADLSGIAPSADLLLRLDSAAAARVARFGFTGPGGLSRTRAIYRHPDQDLSGRFFMPLSALWPEGVSSVAITLDSGFGPLPDLTLCSIEG